MNRLRLLTVFIILLVSSCSTTKYLRPGQNLYNGADVKITDKNTTKSEAKALSSDLQGLLRPQPNGKILGLRVKLWLYERYKTNKKKGLKHYISTSLGEPPVLLNSIDLVKNSSILQNRLQNESYFLAAVSGDTVSKNKIGKAIYTIQTGPAYKYRNITFPKGGDDLDTAVAGTAKQTFLKSGDKYNLDVIKGEFIRVDAKLKEEGYFYFGPQDLIGSIDSTVGGHKVDLRVKIKETTPDEARWIYSVRNIYVYPDYSINDTTHKLDSAKKYLWYNVIDPSHQFRLYTFKNTVLLHPGDIYNRTEHTNSLSRFIQLGPFKYVKNEFEDVTPDSAKLDIYYFLSQQKKRSLTADLVLSQNSADYDGTQVDVSFRNRNLFKGAELYTLTLFANRDIQFGPYNHGYNIYEFGIQPSIEWPRFVGPFNFHTDNAYIPSTILTTGYTYILRTQLYSLNSFNASFGYNWKTSIHVQHQVDIEDFTFVDPENVTQTYLDSIQKTRNPQLAHVINKQFTFGPSYTYTYTNTMESYRKNTFYYSGKLSLSGNLVGIATGADTPRHVSKIFGTPFDQYVKIENEIRFYHKLGPASSLAMRFMTDVGLPYGNSTVLPYSQQFFIGGANSLRGFQAHSIGPGGYDLPATLAAGTNFLPDESGDIKIEANIEYRPKLFGFVEGALFVDAGNIWLLNSNPYLPGAAFGKNFLTQIAADAGAGLRLNFTVLLLRVDVGFPILQPNPAIPLHPWQDAVLNIAIGYPF
jgi:outer membrane protein insertion porin family